MHARHYSPALGRFIQPDPDRSEANLYAYAANNPVTELDPDGTCFIVCIAIGLVLFGGLGAAGFTATYALETPRDNWSAEGARAAAVEGAISGASVVPVGRVAGLATRVASKVPKASRAMAAMIKKVRPKNPPKWTKTDQGRPGFDRRAAPDVYERAKSVPGGKKCSTCPRVFPRPPSSGVRRTWDIDHRVKWRLLRPVARVAERTYRGAGRSIYNLRANLRLRCQACNRADQ
jgi:hypothetical protein